MTFYGYSWVRPGLLFLTPCKEYSVPSQDGEAGGIAGSAQGRRASKPHRSSPPGGWPAGDHGAAGQPCASPWIPHACPYEYRHQHMFISTTHTQHARVLPAPEHASATGPGHLQFCQYTWIRAGNGFQVSPHAQVEATSVVPRSAYVHQYCQTQHAC